MGRKCAVPGCLSEEGRDEDLGVTFHKIPLHSDIRPKWMSLCHIPEDKQFIKVVHVCSRHFLKADFCQFKGRKYMLRQGVLPTVFPWSKLKKELNDDGTSSNTKVEESPKDDNVEQVVNNEPPAKMDVEIKTENNDEPTDFVMEETINLKEEGGAIKEETITLSNPSDVDAVKNKKPVERSSTIIEQKGKAIQTASGVLNFVINERLEALDVKQMWFPAHIIEIDYEDNEVLIHFEKYSSKFDEWISMDSCRLRPIQPPSKKQMFSGDIYSVGEKCMASWSDARKFPATITKVIDKDTYEVLFNDGVVKVLKSHRIAKADAKVIGSAPLFKPVEGTKQDRRDKKRKLNVAKLFHKRVRYDTDEGVSNIMAEEGMASPIVEETEGVGVYPRWENGRPVGTESAIETNDGLRKSIVVVDTRLPPNWLKHLSQRTHGVSAGKWDTFIINPEGRKFRIRSEVKTYIEENPHLNLNEAMFDFALHRKPRAAPRRSLPQVDAVPPEPMVVDEEVEALPSLKISMVGNAYICPIEGCGKNFRRANLAQMHVKHYHPEYTKFLDSTPNVADLAYARTVGDSLDNSPERNIKSTPVRQPQKCVTPKVVVPKTVVSSPSLEINITTPQLQSIDSQASQFHKTKDSEIVKLLNSKPIVDTNTLMYPPGLPSNMYPDIKLKDLLIKSEGIPKREDLNLKNLSTTRPTGIKTLLPVVRTTEPKKDGDVEKPSSSDKKNCGKQKRQLLENVDSIVKPKEVVESTTVATNIPILSETNSNYIVEGGEVIKIVQMKSEEIINCTCGITEEDGLMIQCEVCLCWQHAYCNNIERENQVPDNYICYICQNPVRQRSSKKYYHDQDWLKNGTLPVASYHCKDEEVHKKRFEDLKLSHDLSGRLIELKDFMHSLKTKMKIADVKNHPKLYLWSKPWEKLPLPEKQDFNETEETKPKCSLTENEFNKSDIDLLSNKTEVQNDSMLMSLLKSTKDEQKLKDEMDINNLLANNLEQLPISGPMIPQPEAAIDSGDCKINLLDHIAHSQTLVEERLNNLEEQIDKLDSDDNDSEQNYARTCVTIQMLLKDLNTLKELSHNNNL